MIFLVPKNVKYVMKTTIIAMIQCINDIDHYWQKRILSFPIGVTYLALDNALTYLNSADRYGIFDVYKIKRSTISEIYDAISLIKKSLFSIKENPHLYRHYIPSAELNIFELSIKMLCSESNFNYDKLKKEVKTYAE